MRDEERGLLQAIWSVLRSPLPPGYGGRPTFGWLIVVLFAVQLFTGVLLAMYYQPSPAMVGESLRHLMRDVSSGWLIRGIHHWASCGMIVLCLLQLLRFVFNGDYRRARAGHWFLGLAMMGLILALAFTGGLMVWDEQAYWQMTRALEAVEGLPVIGQGLAIILRGGSEVTATTLSRAWAAHALVLPWTLALLLALNLWFLGRRRGGRE
jgi:quinol-cytochrome oxidoreductase complex cytochrome b subunit